MRIQLIVVAFLAFVAKPAIGLQSPTRSNPPRKQGVIAQRLNLMSRRAPDFVRPATFKHPQVHQVGGLRSSSTDGEVLEDGGLDVDAIVKYGVALTTELGLFYGIFTGLDKLVAATNVKIPAAVNFIFFFGCALKSRILNPLLNKRPQPKNLEVEDIAPKRVMPSWTPPGVVFPIMWLLIIGPIRAASSVMVYQTVGSYANQAILSLMLHLSIGDVWNTINNTERRYGVAVTGVVAVLCSKAFAAYQYYQVNQTAGKLLGATCIWLTVATALIAATWRLNPNPSTGKPEALYPVKGSTTTKFLWFSGKHADTTA